MLEIATVGRDKSHVWKKNTFFLQRKRKTEKEREGNIWRKKILLCGGDEERRRKIYWKRKDCSGQDGTDIKGSMRGSRGPKKSQHFYCLTHFKISHVKETE